MKTYNVTFKTNNPNSNETFFAKAYASSMKEIKKQAGGSMSPFYGYHLTCVQLSSVDYDYNHFKVIPGFEKEITLTVTWTNGQFEKTMNANSKKEAVEMAKNSDYWPVEIKDYSEMTVIISGRNFDLVLNYDDFK